MFTTLKETSFYLNKSQLIRQSTFSRAQIYRWSNGITERKHKERKRIPEPVAESAVELIKEYPHFSGEKGQAYMLYHELGYIPQHLYKMLKQTVKHVIFQEVSNRKLLPEKTSYEHERPQRVGEIWAEDFTHLMVEGTLFYLSLLIDVASTYYLGTAVDKRVNIKLVEAPVLQALEHNNGRGPTRFLLSDNGSVYISAEHGALLDARQIVQKRIPSCTPEYNGSCECGVKEFKNVFYNVWAQMKKKEADKEKTVLECVRAAVADTTHKMNYEIPRPCLKGVTPYDMHIGIAEGKRVSTNRYREEQLQRKEAKPWRRNTWKLVKDTLLEKEMPDYELITKFCFFLKRPLRKLQYLSPEVLGN